MSNEFKDHDSSYTIEVQEDSCFLKETRSEPKVSCENPFEDQQMSSDESDFDWNDDLDNFNPRTKLTFQERSQSIIREPCCWDYLSPFLKRVIIAIVGSCVFIVVAVIINITLPKPSDQERQDQNFKNIRSNVQCWMYWAACIWHIFWIITFALDSVPSIVSLWIRIFIGRRSERAKTHLEYYMSLKSYVCLVLLAAWNIATWLFLINVPFSSIHAHAYSGVITRAFCCLLVATVLLFGQKTIIQIIALRFHRTAFKDRLAENKKCLKILDALSTSENKAKPTFIANTHPLHRRSEEADKRCLSDIFKRVSSILFVDKPIGDVSGRHKMDINSTERAKVIAKKLFYSLANTDQDSQTKLEVHHFNAYFDSQEEAKEAFDVFDSDGNGNLTRREFRDTVVHIYRERKGLAQAIRDTSQALGKIDGTLLVITCIITLIVSLSIFGVNIWAALLPIGTFFAACAFIFDTSAKALCQGIVFQFVTHPYDSGDLVYIDSSYMCVENIGILGTVFIGSDGTRLYAPTSLLQTKIICNVRRSGNMGESLTINVDFRTTSETILLLREKMADWVQSQSRDFAPGFDIRVSQIIDMNQLILSIWLPHKGNWVDLGKRFQRKSRFMLALKSILTELDIRYELPVQKIKSATDFPNN